MDRLEKVHSFGYIYNNINPQSIMIPLLSDLDQGTLYLTDFLKCRKFEEKPEFLSEILTSKLEDIESLYFMLVFLIKGHLPWGKNIDEIFRKEARAKIKA